MLLTFTLFIVKEIKCDTLIVHGDCDSVVPIEESYDLAKIVGTQVKVINGADHGYNEPDQYSEMKRLIIDFIKDKKN